MPSAFPRRSAYSPVGISAEHITTGYADAADRTALSLVELGEASRAPG